MKTRATVYAILLALILNGCIVKSLHQFYHEENVIYDEALLGTWLDDDHTRWVISPYTFSKGFMHGDTTDNSYLVEFYEDSLVPAKFNAHLFEVEGRKYLDFLPLRENRYDGLLDAHLLTTHSLALIDYEDNGQVTISWFDEEWLNNLFEENRVKIAHEKITGAAGELGSEYVLTASTSELQKFIAKYGDPGSDRRCDDNDNFMCVQLTKTD